MPSVLGVCRLQSSWFDLAALVVGHGRHPLTLLGTDVISELGSAKQDKKDGSKIGGDEAHLLGWCVEPPKLEGSVHQ